MSRHKSAAVSFVPRLYKIKPVHDQRQYTIILPSSATSVHTWPTSIHSSSSDIETVSCRTQEWPIIMKEKRDRSTSISSSIADSGGLIGGTMCCCPCSTLSIIGLGTLITLFLSGILAANLYMFFHMNSATKTCISTTVTSTTTTTATTTTTTSTTTTTTTTTTTSTTTTTTSTTTTTTTTTTTATTTTTTTATTTTTTTATTTTATTTTTTTTTTPIPACIAVGIVNSDFETGTSAGWTIGGGSRRGVASNDIYADDYLPGGLRYNAGIANSHSGIVTPGYDPVLGTKMPNIVHRGNYALRVEDTTTGGYGSVISQAVYNYSCPDIYFAWLAALDNGGHAANIASLMILELKDLSLGDIILKRIYNAGTGSGSVDTRFNQSNTYFYTPSWQIEYVSINDTRLGHNFTLSVLVVDCEQGGHSGRVYIDSFGGIAP